MNLRATMTVRWLLAASLTCATAGCGGASLDTEVPGFEEDELSRLERKLLKRLSRAPGDISARRDLGHLLWMHKGEVEPALEHLEAAAEAGDIISATSLTFIAAGRGDRDLARRWAMSIAGAAAGDDRWESAWRAVQVESTKRALRVLNAQVGQRPSVDAEMTAGLDLEGLSGRDPELAVLASIVATNLALQAGRDPEPALAPRGCVQDWSVGPIEGSLGAVELPDLRPALVGGAPVEGVDPSYVLVALGCGVRVWNATRGQGIRRLATTVTNDADGLYLEVTADDEYRLYVDGNLVLRNDLQDRWPEQDAHRYLDLAPGTHEIEVHLAVPGLTSSLMVNALDGEGAPAAVRSGEVGARRGDASTSIAVRHPGLSIGELPRGLDARLYAPWVDLLELTEQLATGDYDRAETSAYHLRDAPFAEAHLSIASFERSEPTRGGTASSTRLERSLARAADLDPAGTSARVQLLRLQLGRDEVLEVLESIDALSPDMQAHFDLQMLRVDAFLRRESDVQAAQALAIAEAQQPDACAVRRVELELVQRQDRILDEDRLMAEFGPCDRGRAQEEAWHRRRGRRAQAMAITLATLEDEPDALARWDAVARDRVALGDLDGALEARRIQLAFNPLNVANVRAFADIALELGRPSVVTEPVRALAAVYPSEPSVLALQERLGRGEDPLLAWRADGAEFIRRYAERAAAYDGALDAMVLDRDVVWVHEDLSQRHLIHQIIHLRSKESLDAYGEMGVPSGGDLLTMHTIKPDGRVVEPEVISGKSGVSLRELEVGDFVELEYIVRRPADDRLPGYLNLGAFSFQNLRTPFHHSELVVNAPDDLELLIDRRNDAPAPERSSVEGRQLLRFVAREMMAQTPEPNARDLGEELPLVRVTTALDPERWRRVTESNLRLSLRTNPELRRHVAELVKDEPDPEARARLVWDWILDNVEPGDGGVAVTQTFAERQGNVYLLAKAMFRLAGLRSEVWLGRSRFARDGFPEGAIVPENYDRFLLMVWPDADGVPVALMPAMRWMPFGYRVASVADEAVRLRPVRDETDEGVPVSLTGQLPPVPDAVRDGRDYDLRVTLDAAGNGEIVGALELRGVEAIEWRRALEMFDRDRLGEVFQQAELQRLLPGATLSLTDIAIEQEEARELPMVIRFTAEIADMGRRGAEGRRFPAALVPMNPAREFVTLPERWTEMVVGYAERVRARIELHVQGGALGAVPDDVTLEGPFGRFERTVRPIDADPGGVVMTLSSELTVRSVDTDAYVDFIDFARDVETAERAEIKVLATSD